MDVYLDLTLLNIFLISLEGIYLANQLFKYNSSKLIYILTFYNLLQIFLIYKPHLIFLIFYILIELLLYFLISKKSFFKFYLFKTAYKYFFILLSLIFFKNITFKGGIILFNSFSSSLILLVHPFLFFLEFIISVYVEKIYHLDRFKQKILIIFDNFKLSAIGYMDSGNLAVYENTPIIFIASEKIDSKYLNLFNIDLSINYLKGGSIYKASKCLIMLENNVYRYVYISLIERSDFYGCDVLLNGLLC